MVRSGLAGTMTDVSHFWLSIHLLTALLTLGGLVWTALDLLALHAQPGSAPARMPLVGAIAIGKVTKLLDDTPNMDKLSLNN